MYTVDASVWVNAFDQREQGHDTSREVLEVLRDRALPVFVPNLLLVEVAGAISRTRNNPAQAQDFAMNLLNLPRSYGQMGISFAFYRSNTIIEAKCTNAM